MAKKAAKAMTKTDVLNNLAERTGLSKKEVGALLEQLGELAGEQLGKKGPGAFTVPGLMKLKAVHKPATKEHTRPDPFNPGQMMTVKAKPASTRVKITALKKLKDMV